MNLYGIGARLMNNVRPFVAGFDVVYSRGSLAASASFKAGSPPVTNTFVGNTGAEMGVNDRIFVVPKTAIYDQFGDPKRGDTIIDESDGSCWVVRPLDGLQDAWRYHGQTKDSYFVFTKRQSPATNN
jgi:hypothetical protein